MATHHHHHGHHHEEIKSQHLIWAILLNLLITIIEVIGGFFSNSLALISDALHNLSDTFTILISYFAFTIGKKKSTSISTFGFKRIEILAAFFNSMILIIVCIYISLKAYERFMHPEEIKTFPMLIVATFALIANISAVFIIKTDSQKNINIKSAYLHLLGDVFSSIAVIAGSIFIYFYKIYWIDPLITVLISIFIIQGLLPIIIKSIKILMQISPQGIDISKIKEDVEKIPEVKNLHHIHVWSLGDNDVYFEGHIVVNSDINISKVDDIRLAVENILKQTHLVNHVTLQVELNYCDGKIC